MALHLYKTDIEQPYSNNQQEKKQAGLAIIIE